MKITKKSNLQKIVEKYPASAEILMENGFHCLGCVLSAFETLEEGAKAHGFSKSQIARLINKLNKKLNLK